MPPRAIRLLLGCFAVVLATFGTVWILRRTLDAHEATYQGKSVDEWRELLASHEPGVSNRASIEITSQVIPALIGNMLHDTADSRMSSALADALNSLPGPTIVYLTADTRRANAAEGLGTLGLASPAAIAALMEVLRSRDLAVHASAAEALGKLPADPAQTVPVLLACLNDPQDPGRAEAVTTLASYGTAAKVAVPTLVRLLDDRSSKELMAAVRSTLKQLDPAAAARAGVH